MIVFSVHSPQLYKDGKEFQTLPLENIHIEPTDPTAHCSVLSLSFVDVFFFFPSNFVSSLKPEGTCHLLSTLMWNGTTPGGERGLLWWPHSAADLFTQTWRSTEVLLKIIFVWRSRSTIRMSATSLSLHSLAIFRTLFVLGPNKRRKYVFVCTCCAIWGSTLTRLCLQVVFVRIASLGFPSIMPLVTTEHHQATALHTTVPQ